MSIHGSGIICKSEINFTHDYAAELLSAGRFVGLSA
jgi:hypothetical protein